MLITGCGHSTTQRIVERAEMLFKEPIYGLIGGLHYPVTTPQGEEFRLPLQRIFGKGKWPWDPINQEDVEANNACLHHRHPQLVALSPHDSCAWSRKSFQRAFGGGGIKTCRLGRRSSYNKQDLRSFTVSGFYQSMLGFSQFSVCSALDGE